MKILDARVRWNLGWGNPPGLIVTVDQLPEWSSYRYKHIPTDYGREWPKNKEYKGWQGLYWAEQEGMVQIYSWTGPSDGFGGRTFRLTMEDGTTRPLKGPWDCGTGLANNHFEPSMGVSVEDLSRKGILYASYILVEKALDAVAKHAPYARIIAVPSSTGVGLTNDEQTLAIEHGTPAGSYGGSSRRYVLAVADGRPKPSYSEAVAWGDVPNESHGFRQRREELGLETPEEQERLRQFYLANKEVIRAEAERRYRAKHKISETQFVYVPWQTEWEVEKEMWKESQC